MTSTIPIDPNKVMSTLVFRGVPYPLAIHAGEIIAKDDPKKYKLERSIAEEQIMNKVVEEINKFNQGKFENTFTHCQLAANADKLGGWDNAMAAANAIETGNHDQLRGIVQNYPEATELVERIVEVSSKYR